MDRRIEMRAGVLAGREVVPIPGRPALVIAGDFLEPERRALAELGRQRDDGEVRRQRLGEVDHPHVAGGDGLRKGEGAQHGCIRRAAGALTLPLVGRVGALLRAGVGVAV